MHIIGYVTQNLYINNHEIIISVSQGNTSQTNMVNNNTYEWDQSSGKPKHNQVNSDAYETRIYFVTFCVNLLPTRKENFLMQSYPTSVEAKLHDESRLIQRCFDDNKDDNKR